jgi:hypothetical protein
VFYSLIFFTFPYLKANLQSSHSFTRGMQNSLPWPPMKGHSIQALPFFTRGMQNSLPFPPQGHSIQGPSLLYQGHAKFTALASSGAFNSGPFPALPKACKTHCPFLLRGIQFRALPFFTRGMQNSLPLPPQGHSIQALPFFTRGMQNSLPFPPQRHSIQGPSLLYKGHAKFTALASHEGALDSGPSFLHQGHAKFTALASSEAFNSGHFPSLPVACKIQCPCPHTLWKRGMQEIFSELIYSIYYYWKFQKLGIF